MFCPNCGLTVNKKLKYCSHCGERLSKEHEIDKDGMPGKMLDNILTTIFLVVMFGLGILVGLTAVLLRNNVDHELVAKIVVVWLLAVGGICVMLALQVSKLVNHRLKTDSSDNRSVGIRQPDQMPVPNTAQLQARPEPPISVVEHTTRTLEHVPVERDSS